MLVILTAAVVCLAVVCVLLAWRLVVLRKDLSLTVDVLKIHARHLDELTLRTEIASIGRRGAA
jgi:hypothetical protein